MVAAGADLIDVGGESTRPNSTRISADEEWARIGTIVESLAADGVIVSVDTLHASTAREAARAAEFRGEYRILGTDIDSGSLAIAIANAKKAGVSKYIEFREADATRESLPCDRGVIVCNPPYGERMLEQRSAQQLMRQFGRHLRFADGWKKYIISSEPEFEHYFGKQATKKRKLYNGRLQCNVYMYF